MKSVVTAIRNFVAEEDGVTMIEYGLLAALISVVAILAITAVGTQLKEVFADIAACLGDTSAGGTCPGATPPAAP